MIKRINEKKRIELLDKWRACPATHHEESADMDQMPTVGRVVNYVLHDRDLPEGFEHQAGQIRPAMIVFVVSADIVNLRVFTDGPNDGAFDGMASWIGNVRLGGSHGSWHWPTIIKVIPGAGS